jgi:hypothetical protein
MIKSGMRRRRTSWKRHPREETLRPEKQIFAEFRRQAPALLTNPPALPAKSLLYQVPEWLTRCRPRVVPSEEPASTAFLCYRNDSRGWDLRRHDIEVARMGQPF